MYVLERSLVVPRSAADVFPFFTDATNLERLTPRFLRFHILTPTPIEIRPGALIDYRIQLGGIPMRWRTRIDDVVPNERFTDVQLRGPYKSWRHTHTFRPVEGGTELGDRVEYELPFGPLGTLAHALFVKRQLKAIFDFRANVMRELFGKSCVREV